MVKVIIADALHPSASSLLTEKGLVVQDLSGNKDQLYSSLKEAQAIIVRSATKVNTELLDHAPNMKIVGRAGVGLDNIDLDECKKRGVTVVNSPEGPTKSVAELVLGNMIALSRNIPIVDKGTKNGKWPKKIKGQELYGKTAGIIGSGMIGGLFAQYCIALGMKVLAYDIIKLDHLAAMDGFTYVELDEVLTKADVISLHVPLLPATKHMIDEEAINKMKKGVLLINAARGGIIDEQALVKGLETEKIGGVALDVYENEPVSADHPLFEHENVIATPHIGAQTIQANIKNAQIVCQKIIEYFE